MAMVNITINGQTVSSPPGSTILQAARQVGIDIPTLCDHPALTPIGACRICIVEVTGQRALQTACTFPIFEGMEVQTESPKVVKARKFILDMLFSERNHYCMYCEMSGNCELQSLGYRYGVDHFIYSTYTKPFPVDATHKYLVMEHNRCVLCWRCIRACDEVAANHTLGLRQRGANTMINADSNFPWGDSTCVSCGTCRQVCPTGAIFDKRSAFMGRDIQTESIKSTCSQCSIGCGIDIVVRGGSILRIDGDWDAPVNKGLLCHRGRFDLLYDNRRRVKTPLIRKDGKLQPAGWDEALRLIAEKIKDSDSKAIGAVTSSNATNEALYLLDKLFRKDLKAANVSLMGESITPQFAEHEGRLADIEESDLIIVTGTDPLEDNPVAAYKVKRSVDKGARLIIIDNDEIGLSPFAFMNLKVSEAQAAVEIAGRAEKPVVIYGVETTKDTAGVLKKIGKKASFIALQPGVNTQAAMALGFGAEIKSSGLKMLYVLLGEQNADGLDLFKKINKNTFVAVQSSYVSPVLDRADVVLPSAVWSERSGSLTNTDGLVAAVNKALDPQGEAMTDWEILSLLMEKLGKKHASSLSDITKAANKEIE